MLCKDAIGITLLDIERKEARILFEAPFEGVYCGDYTLLQYLSPSNTTSTQLNQSNHRNGSAAAAADSKSLSESND